MVKPVQEAFSNQSNIDQNYDSLNYLESPDFNKALAEYAAFLQILQEHIPEVHCMPSDPNTGMDSIYCRDASIITDRGVVVLNMGKPLRNTEPKAFSKYIFSKGIEVYAKIQGEGTVEGGDVAWIDRNMLAVGHGYRTNQSGYDQLVDILAPLGIECIQVDLPHYQGPGDVFHLMSIFSPLGNRKAVVYSPLMSVRFRNLLLSMGYTLIEVPDEEFSSLGSNVLNIRNNLCIMVEGNPVTRSRIDSEGVQVITFKGEEICVKGGGGPTCLTRPLLRQI